MKACTHCGVVKPLEAYHFDKRASDGRFSRCRDCQNDATSDYKRENRRFINAQKRRWAKANPEKVRAMKARDASKNAVACRKRASDWNKANPLRRREQVLRRRSLQAGAAGARYTTAEHIASRWALYGGRCFYCGAEAEATDHRVPLSRGGSHWPANLVPCCKSCNSRKHDRSEKVFREEVIQLSHV